MAKAICASRGVKINKFLKKRLDIWYRRVSDRRLQNGGCQDRRVMIFATHQEGRRVEGCDGDGVEDLGLLQGSKLFFSVTQDLLKESLFPGVELQDLYAVQDFVHELDSAVHELHLDLL